ncbi:histone deacetylase 15-like [Nymphaea colorata]|nr:histone deacetylase 15-like [Nymphaea colorata]
MRECYFIQRLNKSPIPIQKDQIVFELLLPALQWQVYFQEGAFPSLPERLALKSLDCYFTSDTYANGHSALAARLAAGLCADLASAIMQGHARNGFALARPPGHHAGLKQPIGFCLHNNAAVAALAAQAAGADRVLIVDWDVHHVMVPKKFLKETAREGCR